MQLFSSHDLLIPPAFMWEEESAMIFEYQTKQMMGEGGIFHERSYVWFTVLSMLICIVLIAQCVLNCQDCERH